MVADEITFGGEIIIVATMDIEMIWLDLADDGDVWGFLQMPKLEGRELVNDDGIFGEAIEDLDGWSADVADEVSVVTFGVEEEFDERTSGAFAFCGGNADDLAWAMFKKVFGDGCELFIFEWRNGRAAKDHIVG